MEKIKLKMKYVLLALIMFIAGNSFAQPVTDVKNLMIPVYGEWKLLDSTAVFDTENLFDYIDGAADNYLSNNFQELLVCTYKNPKGAYITVEVYQHQNPLYAFGIYSQERSSDDPFINIGAQAYYESGILNFACDKYYIKLASHDESAETGNLIKKMAQDLAARINPAAKIPEIFKYFPEKNMISNSETLISTNFLGYEFMQMAWVASYGTGENTFRVFIIELPSADAAKSMLTKYMEKTKTSFAGTEGRYIANDPNNGKVVIEWKGKFIYGLLNDKNLEISEDYLKLTSDNLSK